MITKELTEAFSNTSLPGMSVSMVNEKGLLYQKSFGYADLALEKTYTTQHVQNIASVSKTFIGVSLMKLVEQGLIDLDDPINKYLPFKVINPFHPEVPITIRHLATHASSIKDRNANYALKSYYIEPGYTLDSNKGLSISNRIFMKQMGKNTRLTLNVYLHNILSEDGAWYKRKNFTKESPGAAYHYSNIGATLAAYIVEQVSGMSFDSFTQKEIFNPLQMDETGWFYESVDEEMFVSRYLGKDRKLIPKYDIITYPDGALKTNIIDLSKFFQEMIKGYSGEGTLLKQESYKEMFANQFENSNEKRRGIFWDIFGKEGVGDIGHSGSDPGVLTFMYFNPTTKIGKIMLMNASGLEDQGIPLWQKFITLDKYFLAE